MKKYSMAEIGEKLGIKRFTMERMVARGEIETVKIGKRTFITQEGLDRYLENREKNRRYSLKELGQMLGISRFALEGIVAREEIEVVKNGNRTFVTHDAYQKYLDNISTQKAETTHETLVDRVKNEMRKLRQTELTEREILLVEAIGKALAS
jgi:excisionase family DNA binding protein